MAPGMEVYEPEVRALERENQARPPPPGAVVFYGSSSIRLWTSLASDFAGARKLVEARPRGVFVDVVPAMLSGGSPRPELFEPDGLHLSAKGYALWRDLLLRHRTPLLADAAAP